MTDTKTLKAAFALIADFTGADSVAFENEMLTRHFDSIKLSFSSDASKEDESTELSGAVSLRTSGARTEFDSRVLGLLGRNRGSEVTAANLIERYGKAYSMDPTTAQMRAALNRLIEDGNVSYSGIQRGTKYSRA